jgi:hypothetical protein
MTESAPPPPENESRPYGTVVAFLLLAALLGLSISWYGGVYQYDKVLLDLAVAHWIAAGILLGVLDRFFMRADRRRFASNLRSQRRLALSPPHPASPSSRTARILRFGDRRGPASTPNPSPVLEPSPQV